MATEQGHNQATARGKDKWGIETYVKGSLILSIATVVFAMVLYVQAAFKEVTWGPLMVGAAGFTLANYFCAERYIALRVAVRVLTVLSTAVALIGWIACIVLTCMQTPDPMPSIGMYAAFLSPLPLCALPPLASLVRARKPFDIWLYRITAALYTVMLIISCVYYTFVEWSFGSVYVKVFGCVLAALTANFAFLIPTKEKQ